MQVSFDLNCCLFDVSQVQDQLFAKSALTSQILNLDQGKKRDAAKTRSRPSLCTCSQSSEAIGKVKKCFRGSKPKTKKTKMPLLEAKYRCGIMLEG